MAIACENLSDQIIRALVERTDAAICTFDATCFRLLGHNPAAPKYFSSAGEAGLRLGMSLGEIFGDQAAPAWRHLFERALKEGTFSIEDQVLIPGQLSYLTFVPLMADGHCFAISLVARKLTMPRSAADALRSAEDRFAELFRCSPNALRLTTVEDGTILDANDSFTRLLGYERSELIGHSTLDLGMWVDLKERDEVIASLVSTGRLSDLEVRYRHRDGRVLNCLLAGQVVFFGGIRCLFVSATDITARRAAEQELQESELRFRTLIDFAPEGIMVVDVDMKRCVDANDNVCRILGYEKSVLLQTELASLDLFKPTVIGAHLALTASGQPQTFECTHLRADGAKSVCEVRLTRLPDSKRRLVRASIIDISERKRLELEALQLRAMLEQAQRLESLGTLAGGIAHDFNNILGAIIGYVDLAQAQSLDLPVRSLLEDVERGTKRAVDLVRQILAFSRHSPPDKQPVQVASIVREAVKLIRAALPATVHIHQRYDSSAYVLADATQIHQIVMNLCTNAGLAMRDRGGTLAVTVEERDADASLLAQHPWLSPGRYLCLTVKDTGCGIPREILERIFEPFFTTRPRGQGTGLGLSVVYGIVKGAGGAVSVASEVGNGSTFEVVLPLCAAPAASQKATAVAAKAGRRVLFVDDEVAVTEIACATLKHLGYDVVGFNDPSDALDVFVKRPGDFDVLVTDMTMPQISGTALGAAVRRIRPTLPMILLSGYSDRLTPEVIRTVGFGAYLDKPVRMTTLAQAIERLCAGGGGILAS